jgi:NAD(P)-dependent dehydrogenase (short-subunit alcohol dehydrogenase family)
MNGIAINGAGSAIARALCKNWLDPQEVVRAVPRGMHMPLRCERYLFCQGLLRPKRAEDQTEPEAVEGFHVNFTWIANQCDLILEANDTARICVLGSESGFAGSYDGVYADAKRALHHYVDTKKLRTRDQQLVCVAPTIIRDAGMTTRRKDTQNLLGRAREHPKGRFLEADEVAGLIHHLLYIDKGYLSGITIRMNGGAHNGGLAKG